MNFDIIADKVDYFVRSAQIKDISGSTIVYAVYVAVGDGFFANKEIIFSAINIGVDAALLKISKKDNERKLQILECARKVEFLVNFLAL